MRQEYEKKKRKVFEFAVPNSKYKLGYVRCGSTVF